jgi:VIT1/CCC1 family predicted Fe2+/Mn2+ transporter
LVFGAVLRKEGNPMKHFLRDVLAGFLASLLAALVAHLMNL